MSCRAHYETTRVHQHLSWTVSNLLQRLEWRYYRHPTSSIQNPGHSFWFVWWLQHLACFLCNFSNFASCSSQLIAIRIHLKAWCPSHLELQVVICVRTYGQLLFPSLSWVLGSFLTWQLFADWPAGLPWYLAIRLPSTLLQYGRCVLFILKMPFIFKWLRRNVLRHFWKCIGDAAVFATTA